MDARERMDHKGGGDEIAMREEKMAIRMWIISNL
jgi:hypothetical protein